MKPFLMGAEVEYSMSARQGVRALRRERIHDQLLTAICQRHQWLRAARSARGIYLDNGSRYYLDTGAHNEFCTPELSTPAQIAAYDRAAERILTAARDDVLRQCGKLDICITKSNVNLIAADGHAWGQHEAYTCWVPLREAATSLMGHLVSRLPYAGSGCLSATPSGSGFELSQRARHMMRATGPATTHDRAIFCTRVNKSSDQSAAGWTRTNLISKDSQRCSFGMYLSYGVTGLLFLLLNEGHKIGRRSQLKEPLEAIRAISRDPWLKTKVDMADGRRLTAIDIQRSYLDEVDSLTTKSDLPDWSGPVIEHWCETLDQLQSEPLALARRLDTYLKLNIFQHELSRAGYGWIELQTALRDLNDLRRRYPEAVIRALLTRNARNLSVEEKALYGGLKREPCFAAAARKRLGFAVRLQACELNYHELGGLFDQLAAAGLVDPVVVTEEDVRHAVQHPPAGGRAEARSQCIREFSGRPEWVCSWEGVFNQHEAQAYVLRDPFSGNRERSTSPSPNHPRQARESLRDFVRHLVDL